MSVWLGWVQYWDVFLGVFTDEQLAIEAVEGHCERNHAHNTADYCHVDGPYTLNEIAWNSDH